MRTRIFLALMLICIFSLPVWAQSDLTNAYNRSRAAAALFSDILEVDRSIPQEVIERAHAIAVFPQSLNKESLIGGDDEFNGLVSLRDHQTGLWGPPIFIRFEGELEDEWDETNTNLILIATSARAADIFLRDKFELGKDILVSGGIFSETERLPQDSTMLLGYFYSEGIKSRDSVSLTGTPITNAKIYHDRILNSAVYGESRINRFLPVSRQINSNILALPSLLNDLTRMPRS